MKAGKGFKHGNNLQTYFEQIKGIPLLTFEEELELSRRIQGGDGAARRRLIEANLRLVIKAAKAYASADVPLMDLIQEGNTGLIRAVDKYDHRKQVRFCTYAAWWIRQTIARCLSDKQRIIRLPHKKEEALRKIKHAYQALSQVYLRQPNTGEISAETGIPGKDVEYLLGLARDFNSVDSGRKDEGAVDAIDFHEDHTYSPEKAFIRKSSREATAGVLNKLKEREKRILIYRYQLDGGQRRTLKSISGMMGLSTETVRQIEIKALKKLRGHAEELRMYIEAI